MSLISILTPQIEKAIHSLFDVAIDKIEFLLQNIFKKYKWEWGGNWPKNKKDMPHFQKTLGYSTAELRLKKFNGVYPILTK